MDKSFKEEKRGRKVGIVNKNEEIMKKCNENNVMSNKCRTQKRSEYSMRCMSVVSEHYERNAMSIAEAYCILHGAELIVLNRAQDKFAQAYRLALQALNDKIKDGDYKCQ